MEHEFTSTIKEILSNQFGDVSSDLFSISPLIQYLNLKTVSATRGSKARSSYANLYALFVIVEDYINAGFCDRNDYNSYEGARFVNLFKRQRELPFGSKLQNHALNYRMNQEFKKFFPQIDLQPILRDVETQRYWLNEKLIRIKIGKNEYNIARAIINIINEYIKIKQTSFASFINTCQELQKISEKNNDEAFRFVIKLLEPNIDARIFEIVSYAILKYYYHDQTIYFGFDLDNLEKTPLTLYKTGRTNANDGGIDFVMRPLGRFFQVTESLDVRKYFLDIDKIDRYPISFVIKSEDSVEYLKKKLMEQAKRQYLIKAIVNKYMSCIEEIINIPILKERFQSSIDLGYQKKILNEIIRWSKVEFNL